MTDTAQEELANPPKPVNTDTATTMMHDQNVIKLHSARSYATPAGVQRDVPEHPSLLDMPAEVRNTIWKYIARGLKLRVPTTPSDERQTPAMLLVSKQVTAEYRIMMLHEATITTTLQIYDFHPLVKFLASLEPTASQALRSRKSRVAVELLRPWNMQISAQSTWNFVAYCSQNSSPMPAASIAQFLTSYPLRFSIYESVSTNESVWLAHEKLLSHASQASFTDEQVLKAAMRQKRTAPRHGVCRTLLMQIVDAHEVSMGRVAQARSRREERLVHIVKRLEKGTSHKTIAAKLEREVDSLGHMGSDDKEETSQDDGKALVPGPSHARHSRGYSAAQSSSHFAEAEKRYWPQLSYLTSRNFVADTLGGRRVNRWLKW